MVTVRDVSGAVALALLATGLALIPTAFTIGLYMCAGAAFSAAVALVTHIVAELRFRQVRLALGGLLLEGDGLTRVRISTAEEKESWKETVNAWHSKCVVYLTNNLSEAHAATFTTITDQWSHDDSGAFDGEHGRYLDAIKKYLANLKAITGPYLSISG